MPESRGQRQSSRQRKRAPSSQPAQLAELRHKYEELCSKHSVLVRQASAMAAERSGVHALAHFALRSSESAYAIADREHVLFRNGRWHRLERMRTRWRATAREPLAPASAPTLLHLATEAAQSLLSRRGPSVALARYERPEHGDAFEARFEALGDGATIGIAIRDVTRLTTAERELAAAHRALEAARGVASGAVLEHPERPRASRPPRG